MFEPVDSEALRDRLVGLEIFGSSGDARHLLPKIKSSQSDA
jgi:hypothetical protein